MAKPIIALLFRNYVKYEVSKYCIDFIDKKEKKITNPLIDLNDVTKDFLK